LYYFIQTEKGRLIDKLSRNVDYQLPIMQRNIP